MKTNSPPESGHYCPRCGHFMGVGEKDCANCASRHTELKAPREWVLTLSLALLVPGFLITGGMTRAYHTREATIAAEWFAQGEEEFNTGHFISALVSLRTALAYAPDDAGAQLRLAEALIATGRNAEAQTYLDNVLSSDSGNGPANLERARLAVHTGTTQDVLRYYHNAFYGEWPNDDLQKPLQARMELCKYLLGWHDAANAEAELISLSAATPSSDAAMHSRIGWLFLQNGSAPRALSEFRLALQANPGFPEGLKGAGLASMDLGSYEDARSFLEEAHRVAPDDVSIAKALDEVSVLVDADPLAKGLPDGERLQRARAAFEAATARLQNCAKSLNQPLDAPTPETDLQTASARVKSLAPLLKKPASAIHMGQIEDLTNVSFDIEKLTAARCGAPMGIDLALLRLAEAPRKATP